MKKILSLISLVFILVSCKDGILVHQCDRELNMVLKNNGTSVDIKPRKAVLVVNGVTLKFVKVESGTFSMGSNVGNSDEKPIHSVTLSDYYISETEVTQELWTAVIGTTVAQQRDLSDKSWNLKSVGEKYPMYYVSWHECQQFVEKLNVMTGATFTLPTEAQWEFAARGGNKSQGYKYSGSNDIESVAWYLKNSSDDIQLVGTKQANELGIYDMSGNVWEWCQDYYAAYSSDSQTDPVGPSTGQKRVLRGSSYCGEISENRLTLRHNEDPTKRYCNLGFRLVIVP